jgi:hypothetical protein
MACLIANETCSQYKATNLTSRTNPNGFIKRGPASAARPEEMTGSPFIWKNLNEISLFNSGVTFCESIIIVPLSHYVGSAQHVFFFHSLLSLVISMLTPFIFMTAFTQSIHLFLRRPLLGCPMELNGPAVSALQRAIAKVKQHWSVIK